MYEEAGTKAAEFAWKHRSALQKAAAELFEVARRGRTRVLVFGAGGVGKSSLGKLLAGKLTDEELLKGYRDSFTTEQFPIPETLTGRILVAPGQRHKQGEWDDLLVLLRAGKVGGVINMVGYGYHSLRGSYRDHALQTPGMTPDKFREVYLPARRRLEIEQLTTLAPELARAPNKLWFMTLVSKQDLWWDRRAEVAAHYETGQYAEIVAGIQATRQARNFPHEVVAASLTIENLYDGAHETLAPTVAGYDHRMRLANLGRFSMGLRQLVGTAR